MISKLYQFRKKNADTSIKSLDPAREEEISMLIKLITPEGPLVFRNSTLGWSVKENELAISDIRLLQTIIKKGNSRTVKENELYTAYIQKLVNHMDKEPRIKKIIDTLQSFINQSKIQAYTIEIFDNKNTRIKHLIDKGEKSRQSRNLGSYSINLKKSTGTNPEIKIKITFFSGKSKPDKTVYQTIQEMLEKLAS